MFQPSVMNQSSLLCSYRLGTCTLLDNTTFHRPRQYWIWSRSLFCYQALPKTYFKKKWTIVKKKSHLELVIHLELSRVESYNYGQDSDLAIKRVQYFNPFKRKQTSVRSCSCQWWYMFPCFTGGKWLHPRNWGELHPAVSIIPKTGWNPKLLSFTQGTLGREPSSWGMSMKTAWLVWQE